MTTKRWTKEEVKTLVETILYYRGIPLPTTRLLWYCRWFQLPVPRSSFHGILKDMVREGTLDPIREGQDVYYKLKS